MTLRSGLYTYGIWPMVDRDYRGFGRRLRRWQALEQQPLEENLAQQWQALVRILRHAHDSSAFYRQRFHNAGLQPDDLRRPEDLRALPPLTRADLRQHLDTIISNRYRAEDLCAAASGGTTDTPVPLRRDRAGVAEKRTVQEAFHHWAGIRPGDRVLWLWGARTDYAENPGWRWRLYDRHLMRRVWLPTSRFNAEILEEYRVQLNRFRPRAIVAYPTPLHIFTEYLERCGREYWRPHSVVVTAEALLPQQRQQIERTLGCGVFEHYGSREFAMIGGECEAHAGMHLNPLAAYVEYQPLREAGESTHELLVTDLLNYGMPLIRYRINDCAGPAQEAEFQPCSCGRGYPRLRPVVGRSVDVFRFANGDLLPGVALTNRLLQVVPGLAKVQVIQETLQDFHLRYVAGTSFSAADLDLLRAKLGLFFPAGLRWRFEAVAEIPREASGKTRFCISRVGAAGSAAGEGRA